jgi:glycosyltransferase involved in cell wall biosynthesis
MKKLSVITVTYNCAALIERTLESVLSKRGDIAEHIVIDGGSIDGTLAIIDKYRDKLAYFISEPDRGIYDAMNKGIDVATGEWILFLNAGDVFYDNLQLQKLKFDWPRGTEFVAFPFLIEGETDPKFPDLNTRFGMPSSHQAMLISAAAAKETPLNRNYKVAADYEFYVKRRKSTGDCARLGHDILTLVQPGGYSGANLNTMKREYQRIILKNFGWKKAVIYFFWCRPLVFGIIKAILPVAMFDNMKKRL